MIECSQQHLQALLTKQQTFVLFIYTPFCGTCKLAEQMLNIIETTYTHHKIYKSDIRFIPEFRQTYRITSVPCLLRFISNQPMAPIYAFQSIPFLLERLDEIDSLHGG